MSAVTTPTKDLRASIKTSLKRLAAAVDKQASSDEFLRYLKLQARFPRYSFGNCLLIALQRPNASLVAGFNRWKELGRHVRRGEKAIRIMAPCPVRRQVAGTDEEEERLFFKTVCVWDRDQTEGRALPRFEVPQVYGDADQLLRTLEQVAALRGIAVTYSALGEGHFGTSKGGHIEIANGHGTGQQAKTLAHELAHEALHQGPDGISGRVRARDLREMEAESVAYVVCQHFGLDVEVRASRYITFWAGDAKAMAKSFNQIARTAREMIDDAESVAAIPSSEKTSHATNRCRVLMKWEIFNEGGFHGTPSSPACAGGVPSTEGQRINLRWRCSMFDPEFGWVNERSADYKAGFKAGFGYGQDSVFKPEPSNWKNSYNEHLLKIPPAPPLFEQSSRRKQDDWPFTIRPIRPSTVQWPSRREENELLIPIVPFA